jgi:hypothetical protein
MLSLSLTMRQCVCGGSLARTPSRKAAKSLSVRVGPIVPWTRPVATSKQAISVWVPWRLYSNSRRSIWPARIGRVGVIRSRA